MHPKCGHTSVATNIRYFCVLTKSVIYGTNQPIIKFQNNCLQGTTVHFECLFCVFSNISSELESFFKNILINYFYRIHAINTVICGIVVTGAVDDQVIIIFVKNQSNRFHHIMMTITTINFVTIGIQVKVAKDNFFLLL